MRMTRLLAGALPLALALAVAGPSLAQTEASPDNTKLNRSEQPTADQQTNAQRDRELTRRIRRAIASDKQLSTNAHNVKVITQGGKVTLKGPVRSPEEKQAVEAKAAAIAGQGNVISDIRIASKDQKG